MASRAEELCLLSARDLDKKLKSIGAPPRNGGPISSTRIEPNDFKMLCRPGVYIFWQKDRALYIGTGKRVINRMSTGNHGAVGLALQECTSIEVLFFKDACDAAGHESQLIADLQPMLNRRGLGSALSE